LIECDFQSHYHLDLADLRSKSAYWLRVRIAGLLSADTRLARALTPESEQERSRP
jgi:hypothetical protein